MTTGGQLLGRLSGEPAAGNEPGQFLSTHSIAVDQKGELYVGQVGMNSWPALFPDKPVPEKLCRVRKLTKLPAG